MIKPLLLRLHRWISLAFALPLFAIVASGVILSFEPMLQAGGVPSPVDATRLSDIIKRYDPDGKARGLPRLIHEGNWSAMIASPLNVLTSLVLFGLLSTGVLLWSRRTFRRRPDRAAEPRCPAPEAPSLAA